MTHRLEGALLAGGEEIDALGDEWRGLPPTRGAQADLYDSWEWFGAWRGVLGPEQAEALRVVTVRRDGRLAAALPLMVRGGSWRMAGVGYRPRLRPVLRDEQPAPEVLDQLVETLARSGAREIVLDALPSRDPATGMLAEALRRGGYITRLREGTSECLTPVEGDWADHARRFRKYHRTVKNFSNKAGRLGKLQLREWGGADRPAVEGLDTYLDLHARGWKGPLGERMARHRRALLEACSGPGVTARVFALEVGGVSAAAIVWFLVGEVAVAYSTVYDETLAALSAGTILMWLSHERIFAERRPALLDYLPGQGAQKSQLGALSPRLQNLEAARSRIVALTGPLRRGLARRAERRRGRATRVAAADPPPAARQLPSSPSDEQPIPAAEPTELDAAQELYVAVAGGHSSVRRMKESWGEGAAWWRIGAPLRALGRVEDHQSASRLVELVLVGRAVAPAVAAAAIAEAAGRAVDIGSRGGESGVLVRQPRLAWPFTSDQEPRR